jgi:NADPH:quinone reductase-like Zn-dependent oxidoreductase
LLPEKFRKKPISMKAITKSTYGGPEVLKLSDVARPEIDDDQLLVRVMANSANAADWHVMRGKPLFARFSFGLFKPKNPILGADFAGIVEEIGKEVKSFQVGDRVYGESLQGGAFSEFTAVAAAACARIPDSLSYATMAAVPIAGITALQALITHGKLKADESVLINGSSGGVGHFTVQIARAYGARVTGVCSSANAAFVKSLGAQEVVAYDQEDIHQHTGRYDLVIDNHGNLRFSDFKRLGKRGVLVGFTALGHMMQVLTANALSKFHLAQFTAMANTADLEILANLVKEGKVKPHIEKTYPFEQIPAAISYIEKMRTRGKVVMQGYGQRIDE